MALRPEIRELVLLFAQQAAREILAAEAAALAKAATKEPRDLSGDGLSASDAEGGSAVSTPAIVPCRPGGATYP